jgi:hypothetical protein
MLLAAKPWHYWIALFLLAPAVLGVVAVMFGYYVKVTRNKYPR